MKKQFKTVLLVATAAMMLAGCDKNEADVKNTENTEKNTDATTVAMEEVTTAGMEEISGTLNITGTSVVSNNTSSNGYGNSAGNLINSGIVCEANGKIYYYNKSDDKYLYVMNEDGSDKKPLGHIQGAMELNVNGDYIYYQAGGIYRAKLKDGEIETLVESGCRNMVVADNLIYYIKADGETSKIYKMNLDGSGEQALSENIASGLNVKDGYIYYINGSDSGKIYRMNLDGTEDTEIINSKNVQELLVDAGCIYYVNSSNAGNHVYRVNMDGSDEKEIIEDSCSNININNNKLFYYNASDDALCYSELDGTGEKVLYNGQLNAINVISDWVYFFNTDDFQYYRITKDGNNIEVVE